MIKLITWTKKHKFLTVIIVLILVPPIAFFKPYKPTNPSNPLFVESWFRLSDYDLRANSLNHALKVLFPVGTDKKYVDLMLHDRGGADILDKTKDGSSFYAYFYQGLTMDGIQIRIYYNQHNKVDLVMNDEKVINGVWDANKYLSKEEIAQRKYMQELSDKRKKETTNDRR